MVNVSGSDANKSGISSDRRTVHCRTDGELDVIQEHKLDELQRGLVGQHLDDSVMYHDKHDNGSRESRRVMLDRRNGEQGEMEGLLRPQKIDFDALNPESSSCLLSTASYDYGTAARNRNYEDGLNSVGDTRAELLKRLDEIKDQISRSGNPMEWGEEEVTLHRRTTQQDRYVYANRYPGKKLQMDRLMIQEVYADSHFNSPSYQNQYADPTPLRHRQEMRGNGFCPPSESQGYEDSFGTHFYRRGMSQTYMDHHTSCPCYNCLGKRHVPTAYNGESNSVTNSLMLNHGAKTLNYASRDYSNESSSSVQRSHEAQSHTRWPSYPSSEADGTIYPRPQMAVLVSSGIHCLPIAGGSPFLTCHNCFKLLWLPSGLLISNDNRKKIRCGVCSLVISLTVSSKSLLVSLDVEAENHHVKIDKKVDGNENHVKVGKECDDRHANQVLTTFSSDDYYDDPGHDVHPKKSGLVDPSSKDKVPPPLPAGSSLQDYFEYSNKFHREKNSAKGNRNERPEPEKMAKFKSTNEPTSRNESTATETEISSYEFPNTGTTFDSGEGIIEAEHLKASKRADSFFASILKRNHTEDSDRGSNGFDCEKKANVIVNGHLIPDRLITKAEKLAGPIHPGNYWYDFRAGFWGVMGGPCLGIIPPFIEVFNYPMVETCSGGNTEVFVNGRELHQKDLNLLSNRGLPTEKNRSYIIEISGRIIDEETREELQSLGKLAPNVERAKRGFGMKPQ